MANKASKAKCYSLIASAVYRYASVIVQKNKGENCTQIVA